jgi:hypothetical protein
MRQAATITKWPLDASDHPVELTGELRDAH